MVESTTSRGAREPGDTLGKLGPGESTGRLNIESLGRPEGPAVRVVIDDGDSDREAP